MTSPENDDQKPQKNPHRLFYVIVWAFIIAAILGMWAIDMYFSPEMIDERALPEAVGK